jgi:hypothetical protein
MPEKAASNRGFFLSLETNSVQKYVTRANVIRLENPLPEQALFLNSGRPAVLRNRRIPKQICGTEFFLKVLCNCRLQTAIRRDRAKKVVNRAFCPAEKPQ